MKEYTKQPIDHSLSREHTSKASRQALYEDFFRSKPDHTVQRVLVTDVPNTGDFSQVFDLGIWWAMAAEYHLQQQLPANIPNTVHLNPLDYIRSLSDYVPGAAAPQINVNAGDSVRMLTHGYDPAQNGGQHLIHVNGGPTPVNPLVANIGQVTPLYCYMGNNPAHQNLLNTPTLQIGPGPMLSPSQRSVSLVNNMANLQFLLQNAGAANTWHYIITPQGAWRNINEVGQLSFFFQRYISFVQIHGTQHPRTINLLRILLGHVYRAVQQPYNDFANYLIQNGGASGEGRTLWQ